MDKTQGQIAYEADVNRKPVYHDGKPRKCWEELSDIARWSWERRVALIQQIDELNDLCEGVMAAPMPAHLDREQVKKETAAALKRLLSKE